jgi:hypothetical protein
MKGASNRLPVAGQSGRIGRRVLPTLAARQGIQRRIFGRQQASLSVDAAHLYPVPKAAERKPGYTLVIENQIRIDRIEIVFQTRP